MTLKIVTIVGARPQFIKASTLSRLLQNTNDINEIMVHTGQHYDPNMSPIFFDELDLPKPHYNLAIGSGSHGQQTGEMLMKIEQVLLKEKPDWVLIYGDTNSTLAGALAAAKMHIRIAHVEAGLRSFNRRMPEEINRIVADELADLLFAPTETAANNLQNEGIAKNRIRQVGDVMYDAALYYAEKAEEQISILAKLKLTPKKYVLTTIHRQENTNDPRRLKIIMDALILIAKDIDVIFPLHPRTQKYLNDYNLLEKLPKTFHVVDAVGFLDMIMLEKNACVIATDSGGVQKEAFFYQTPCITLRDETEWIELVELGWNRVVPPLDSQMIKDEVLKAAQYCERDMVSKPYGNGKAAEKIFQCLME